MDNAAVNYAILYIIDFQFNPAVITELVYGAFTPPSQARGAVIQGEDIGDEVCSGIWSDAVPQ